MKMRILISLMLCFALGGCKALGYPLYVLFGMDQKKVKAEYKNLEGKKIGVFVVSRPGIDFEYPQAPMNVALACAYVIGQHVKDVSFVDQEKIQDFQMEDLNWLSMPSSQLGKKFGADRVIYIDMYEYSIYEENSVNLLRGRISADVRIFETDGGDDPAYKTQITVRRPEKYPVAMSNSVIGGLQQQTMLAFAEELAKKFYDHKVKIQ